MSYQLEIHHVDVTGGDATFIVIRHGTAPYPVVYSILVDTGGIGNGPDKLAGYLKKYFPDVKIDLMITSHCHDDHVSGISVASTDGNCVFEPEKLCDVGYDQKDYYPATTPAYDKLLPYVNTYRTFSFKYKEKTKRLIPPFLDLELYNEDKFTGSINSISLKDNTARSTNTGFYLTFWSGKGVLADGTNIIKQQSKPSKVNPNDLSISFTIHNPDTGFSYFSGGDLSGDPALKSYHNVEGPTVDLIAKTFKKWNEDKMKYKFEIKVLKATHHGSNFNNHKKNANYDDKKFNSAPGFLETLQPEVVVVPCNKDLQVPSPVFIKDRLATHLNGVEKRYAYFLNEFSYPNQDRGERVMSDAIKALLAAAPDRTNVILSEVDNWFYTEGIGSVVVVSNSNGPEDLVPPQNMSKLSKTASTNCYTVFINNEEIEVTSLTFRVAAARLADRLYDFQSNEELEGSINIKDGFMRQAKEILSELSFNISTAKINVLKQKFPALLNCFRRSQEEDITEESIKIYLTPKLPEILVSEMIRIFKNCYTFFFSWWARNADIPNEDLITMINLLYYNPYQYQYNYQNDMTLDMQKFVSLLPLEMWGKKTNDEKEQFSLFISKTLGVRPHREEELDTKKPVNKRRRIKK
ncbi:hypothetical protein GWR56_15165 [Mucilaginibacter sp. 14171R-50]|uniref:hypothetical protein n=1 Tax=Mucilaginibacter sp. 14171R-50 TaxID=2703789 RepID=UPI00138DAC46|nr:hypothetical protein [Mucilaginibacter sp. 14171R-50]QHS56819.1 hypothetical protein GWR56_15165 [Mucilaginibacter sp. 14171R-50]